MTADESFGDFARAHHRRHSKSERLRVFVPLGGAIRRTVRRSVRIYFVQILLALTTCLAAAWICPYFGGLVFAGLAAYAVYAVRQKRKGCRRP